jgi:stage II sporulation protein P
MEEKILRIGTLAVVGALALRLLSGLSGNMLLSPEAASWLFFLHTGHVVRPGIAATAPPTAETQKPTTLPTVPPTAPTVPGPTVTAPTQPPLVIPTFSPLDAAAITIQSGFTWKADLPTLLTQPLSWDLTQTGPTVLILHSHATESYTGGGYRESSAYHTLDPAHNMLSIGTYIATRLRTSGISVLQDTVFHDEPSYDQAYNNSRKSVAEYLAQYPSIRLVLDLHRDAYADASGKPAAPTILFQGRKIAPLMFVVGTDYGGLTHPAWQENLALALKLQTQLESICPGICRNINLRSQRFNQDLSPGALLVEVGNAGNSHSDAIGAAEMLVQAILSLAHGSK